MQNDSTRLAPPRLLAGLVAGSLLAFALLFPAADLHRELAGSTQVTAVMLDYLRLLVRADPNATGPRLLLARNTLKVNDPAAARRALSLWSNIPINRLPPKVLSLELELRRALIEAARPGSVQRRSRLRAYAALLRKVSATRIGAADLMALARSSLNLGLYTESSRLALQAIARPAQPAARRAAYRLAVNAQIAAGRPRAALSLARRHLVSVAVDAALWGYLGQVARLAGHPALAAKFALQQLEAAATPAERESAFHAAVAALLAAGQPRAAFAAAERYLGRVPQDQALWRFMTRLALQADRPRRAAYYADRLVDLPPGPS